MAVIQLSKWGNSQGIRIDKETLRSLNFDSEEIEKQKIKFEIKVENGQIILKPIKEKTKLENLFKNFKEDPADYKNTINWGDPVGKEVW